MNKILVIDDIDFTRLTTKRILLRNGFEVYDAKDRMSGLETFVEQSPDLALIDIHMPDMEGLETIRSLVKMSPEISIIAVARHENPYFQKFAAQFGATKSLIKPFSQQTLVEAVKESLQAELALRFS